LLTVGNTNDFSAYAQSTKVETPANPAGSDGSLDLNIYFEGQERISLGFEEGWEDRWKVIRDNGEPASNGFFLRKENTQVFGKGEDAYLRVRFPRGSVAERPDATSTSRFPVPSHGVVFLGRINELDDITQGLRLRYQVRFSPTFDFAGGGTLPGLFREYVPDPFESPAVKDGGRALVGPGWHKNGLFYMLDSSTPPKPPMSFRNDGSTWHNVIIQATRLRENNGRLPNLMLVSSCFDGKVFEKKRALLAKNDEDSRYTYFSGIFFTNEYHQPEDSPLVGNPAQTDGFVDFRRFFLTKIGYVSHGNAGFSISDPVPNGRSARRAGSSADDVGNALPGGAPDPANYPGGAPITPANNEPDIPDGDECSVRSLLKAADGISGAAPH
jgi:hypothetical protein